MLAHTGPPPLTELPLDPAALLAEPVVDAKLDAHLATAGLDEDLVGTLALPDSTAFRWPAIGAGPGGGVFRFSLLAGLEHHYPHVRNNDAGFEAAPESGTSSRPTGCSDLMPSALFAVLAARALKAARTAEGPPTGSLRATHRAPSRRRRSLAAGARGSASCAGAPAVLQPGEPGTGATRWSSASAAR